MLEQGEGGSNIPWRIYYDVKDSKKMDRKFGERRDPLSVVESGELYTRPPRTAL